MARESRGGLGGRSREEEPRVVQGEDGQHGRPEEKDARGGNLVVLERLRKIAVFHAICYAIRFCACVVS
jgi:hypothetical protein